MESAHKIVSQNSHHHHSMYRECLKNHAATLGAHATDGCCEFIPSLSSAPSDPTSLTCAACGCHRNFHRRESDLQHADQCIEKHKHPQHEDDETGSHVLLSLKTGGGGRPGFVPAAAAAAAAAAGARGKKRFRSKFSREQKDGMMELAERIGWRLQRRDEDIVEDGCRAAGVDRAVFKVWMHNNKQAVLEMKRRSRTAAAEQEQEQQ